MDDEATVAYISASAQSMLSESYNFTAQLEGPGTIKVADAGEVSPGARDRRVWQKMRCSKLAQP